MPTAFPAALLAKQAEVHRWNEELRAKFLVRVLVDWSNLKASETVSVVVLAVVVAVVVVGETQALIL